MQLIGAATLDVPNQTPMPQPSKQLLNVCPIPPVHVIVTLLAGCESVDCESLTPTQGATQQSVDLEIVPVSSIAPKGWGPKEGGNATSPLHSRGSPTKVKKSEVKTYARGHNGACIGNMHLIANNTDGPQMVTISRILQSGGQNQQWPTGGHIGYMHAFSVKLVIFFFVVRLCNFLFAVNRCKKLSCSENFFAGKT